MEERSYPFEGQEKKRSYPFEESEKKRSYPFEASEKERSRAPENTEEEAPARKGKGRRGGNSPLSFVIRAARTEDGERREKPGGYRLKSGETGGQDRSGNRGWKKAEGRRQDGAEKRGHGGSSLRWKTDGRGREEGFRRDQHSHGPGRSGERGPRQHFAPSIEGLEDFSSPRRLSVLENTQIGSFLDLGDGKKVLLPFAEQTERPKEGGEVSVCLYQDKGGRLTATMRTPHLKEGEVGRLKVAEITKIGLFLDNGVPKQLLVPFKEQICTPKPGSDALVYLYRDKSGRPAATMRVYRHLSSETPYQADDRVEGFVYEINSEIGIFVAVDDKYFGLIPKSEVYRSYRYGQTVSCRVLRVREDGKLDLSEREKSYEAIGTDADAVLAELKAKGGHLPYADRADAKLIEEVYGMSKNQFKRAVGSLYRQRKISIDRENDTITLL